MPLFAREQIHNVQNVRKTKGLFVEYGGNLLTLAPEHHHSGAYSFRKLFVPLTVDDPLEYTFATEVFGDMKFWEKLRKSLFLQTELEACRQEAHAARCQKAFNSLMETVKEGGPSSTTAAKYIMEKGWEPKPTSPKKRQERKEEITASINKGLEDSEVQEDIKRMGLLN